MARYKYLRACVGASGLVVGVLTFRKNNTYFFKKKKL